MAQHGVACCIAVQIETVCPPCDCSFYPEDIKTHTHTHTVNVVAAFTQSTWTNNHRLNLESVYSPGPVCVCECVCGGHRVDEVFCMQLSHCSSAHRDRRKPHWINSGFSLKFCISAKLFHPSTQRTEKNTCRNTRILTVLLNEMHQCRRLSCISNTGVSKQLLLYAEQVAHSVSSLCLWICPTLNIQFCSFTPI